MKSIVLNHLNSSNNQTSQSLLSYKSAQNEIVEKEVNFDAFNYQTKAETSAYQVLNADNAVSGFDSKICAFYKCNLKR